jgi:hypothetical protein
VLVVELHQGSKILVVALLQRDLPPAVAKLYHSAFSKNSDFFFVADSSAHDSSDMDYFSLIASAYKFFKETYGQLKENEEALQQLLDELFLYEPLILIYAEQFNKRETQYAEPVKLFSESVSGLHGLLLDYSSEKLSRLQRAWNFCKNWVSSDENSIKIKRFTENMSRAVELLGFSGEVLILNKIEKFRGEQAKVFSLLANLTSAARSSLSFMSYAVFNWLQEL